MYKDELIQLHQFLVYVLKHLENEYEVNDECREYLSLNISPHHIHRTKAEHKHAIFVLSTSISEVVATNNGGTSSNISNGLSELVKRSRKELIRYQNEGSLKYENKYQKVTM
ncbi:MAG: UPF0058 family protein [Methanobacteriaceae archaeon]|nr:UPF0058 family protein [Methanobacteriaceae archaeon]